MAEKTKYKRRTKEELEKLKAYAKILITKEGHTQASASEIVEVSKATINKWYKDGKWDELEKHLLNTRQELLVKFYKELEEFDAFIQTKPEGQRFADSKEADARTKLMKNIQQFEDEASLAEIIASCKALLEFVRKVNLPAAQSLSNFVDAFIKSKL